MTEGPGCLFRENRRLKFSGPLRSVCSWTIQRKQQPHSERASFYQENTDSGSSPAAEILSRDVINSHGVDRNREEDDIPVTAYSGEWPVFNYTS
jgi:hypothetical protein